MRLPYSSGSIAHTAPAATCSVHLPRLIVKHRQPYSWSWYRSGKHSGQYSNVNVRRGQMNRGKQREQGKRRKDSMVQRYRV
jgi:hypothetical protein